ncbi:unnamed protein product [Heterobilharzia americana]|nr:unnamed protein product [Heterobilharzia americana]
MSCLNKSPSTVSSPDLFSLVGSCISEEDRIDSDIEADILQASVDDITVRTCSPASLQSVQSSRPSNTSSVFIRKAVLSSVSSQLKNASLKGSVGYPSCISFRKYVAIGTSKGVVFIFNLHQVLKLCFGNISPTNTPEAKVGEGQGPITVLSQNPNGTLLMSAYCSGRIALWQIPASVLCDKSEQDLIKGRLYSPDEECDAIETTRGNGNYHNSSQVTHDFLPQETSVAEKNRSSLSYTSSYGRLLCIIDDAHGVDHSINLCCFTTVSSLAACVDTGGSVFQLKFTKGLVGLKTESMCFFSGSRVEICTIEALGFNAMKTNGNFDSKQLGDQYKEAKLSILTTAALLAITSFTKLIIVRLRPRIQVSYWQPLKGPPAFLPCLNWYWCADSSDRAFLAFGRGSVIQIMQVSKISRLENMSVDSLQMTECSFPDSSTLLRTNTSMDNQNQLDFKLLYSFSFEQNFLNLKWISFNQSFLTGEILETVDISNTHLRYNSDLFKYPKVSEALAFAGERACMHSLTAYRSQLLLLGETGLYLITLRTWDESVTFLLRRKQLLLALNYMEAAMKSQFNKLSYETDRKSPSVPSVYNQILTILRDEVLRVLVSENDGDNTWISGFSIMESIVRIACMIKKPDFIWSDLYPAVRHHPQLTSDLFAVTFSVLKSLPPFGQLCTECCQPVDELNSRQYFINLPPDMTNHFIKWCLNQDNAMEVHTSDPNSTRSDILTDRKLKTEICLLRLHPSCLDFNHAVKICWTECLFDAYLHLYTDILMDFETPFIDLTRYLVNNLDPSKGEAGKDEKNRIEKCVHCLLVLLRLAFASESFCHQRLPPPLDQNIPLKVFNLMLSESLVNMKGFPASILNVKYPFLHSLLQYSPIDFLNLLTLSTSGDEFFVNGELGQSRRQQLYNCLLLTSLPTSSSTENSPQDPVRQSEELHQTNCRLLVNDLTISCRIFIFIIRQLSLLNSEEIKINHNLIYQLFELVCSVSNKLSNGILSEFELATIESIESGRLKHIEQCVSLSSDKELYKVCEHIHRTCGNELLVLKYQILRLKKIIMNKSNRNSTLVSIHSDSEAVKLASCIFQCLESSIPCSNKELKIDGEKYDNLKSICFENTEVLADWDDERTLKVLHKLTNVSISQLLDFINVFVKEESSNRRANYLILRAYFKCRKMFSEVTELYISLLIRFGCASSSDALLTFLESFDNYRIDLILKVISVENYPREVAYLYEKSGNLSKATELYEQVFSEAWQKLIRAESNHHKFGNSITVECNLLLQKLYTDVQQANRRLLNFCQRRCAQSKDQSEIEVIWFSVIDLLMKCEFLQNHPMLNAQLSGIFYYSFSLVMAIFTTNCYCITNPEYGWYRNSDELKN